MDNGGISFCTVSMNRLIHLKETLPKNIEDNSNYPNIEFVLLDYNSNDGTEVYVRSELSEFINKGILVYYRTTTPKFFHRSHSRNVAFRLATGDILCNVDADNFTGEDFSSFLSECFSSEESIFLSSTGFTTNLLGRICLRKRDFCEVTGYDEEMSEYGFEDYDLISRLELKGLVNRQITDNKYLQAIQHGDRERIVNERPGKLLSGTLVHLINYYSSEIILLFKDGRYDRGTIINNSAFKASIMDNELEGVQPKYEFSLMEDGWMPGEWQSESNRIVLKDRGLPELVAHRKDELYIMDNDKAYFLVNDNPAMAEEAVFFYSQIKNRLKMERNQVSKQLKVNTSFGEEVVFKNFDYNHPIRIHGNK